MRSIRVEFIKAEFILTKYLRGLVKDINQVIEYVGDNCENIVNRYPKNKKTRGNIIAVEDRLRQLEKVTNKIRRLEHDLDKAKINITLEIGVEKTLDEIVRTLYKMGKSNIPYISSTTMNSQDLSELKKLIISNLGIVEED